MRDSQKNLTARTDGRFMPSITSPSPPRLTVQVPPTRSSLASPIRHIHIPASLIYPPINRTPTNPCHRHLLHIHPPLPDPPTPIPHFRRLRPHQHKPVPVPSRQVDGHGARSAFARAELVVVVCAPDEEVLACCGCGACKRGRGRGTGTEERIQCEEDVTVGRDGE